MTESHESFARCDAALDRARAADERMSLWVPGRIEVFGKHTDYAGGRSLLCAIDRGFRVRVAPRRDVRLCVVDVASGERFETEAGVRASAPIGTWENYVAVVARRLARDFAAACRGADIAFISDLPPSAGLSSSSALVVAIALGLIGANALYADHAWNDAIRSRAMLAGYLGAVENGRAFGPYSGDNGVGTFGGSEDHTAILWCVDGVCSQFAFAPVVHERDVLWPGAYSIHVASSGVSANKTANAITQYNALSLATVALLATWNRATGRTDPTLGAAMASSPHAAERLARAVDRRAQLRLEQFVEESLTLVPGATAALAHADMAAFGALADRSHQLAARNLDNQVPQTMMLQRRARELGALAASAFGAGFGGSVWAVTEGHAGGSFLDAWKRAYADAFPACAAHARFFTTKPSGGAELCVS